MGANLPLTSLLAGGRWELKSSPCSCAARITGALGQAPRELLTAPQLSAQKTAGRHPRPSGFPGQRAQLGCARLGSGGREAGAPTTLRRCQALASARHQGGGRGSAQGKARVGPVVWGKLPSFGASALPVK